MWVRQCELDAQSEAPLPIPARIASNEEFIPPPQSPQQKEYEARLIQISDNAARRLGISRRDFLRTGSGTAAALVALNQVFGDCYDVSAAEVEPLKRTKAFQFGKSGVLDARVREIQRMQLSEIRKVSQALIRDGCIRQ